MNRVHLAVALLHFVLLLFAVPVASSAIYESHNVVLAHSQLTLDGEENNLPKSGYNELQDGSAQSALFDPLEDLRQALEVMQSRWFKVSVGTWPTAIDWTRAVVDTFLVSSLSSLSKVLYSGQTLQGANRHSDRSSKQVENEINQYFTQNVGLHGSLHEVFQRMASHTALLQGLRMYPGSVSPTHIWSVSQAPYLLLINN